MQQQRNGHVLIAEQLSEHSGFLAWYIHMIGHPEKSGRINQVLEPELANSFTHLKKELNRSDCIGAVLPSNPTGFLNTRGIPETFYNPLEQLHNKTPNA